MDLDKYDLCFIPAIKQQFLNQPTFVHKEILIRARLYIFLILNMAVGSVATYFLLDWGLPARSGCDSTRTMSLYTPYVVFLLIATCRWARNIRLQTLSTVLYLNMIPWIMARQYQVGSCDNFASTPAALPIVTMGTVMLLGTRAGVASFLNVMCATCVNAHQHHDLSSVGQMMVQYFYIFAMMWMYEMLEERRALLLDGMNTALAKAVDEARVANEHKTLFLANTSHELRTPLHGIIGTTEILSHSSVSQVIKPELDVIRQCSAHLLNIMTDILDLSKITANKLELSPVPTSIHDLVGSCFDTVSYRAFERGVQLVSDLTLLDPEIKYMIDATRLGQVFLNLLTNAIKFSHPNSDVVLRARLVPAKKSDTTKHPRAARLEFEVIDSGIGIAERNLESIFQPFNQVDMSTTRPYEGTGLGLAICRSLIEEMSGFLRAESTLGQGSTFRVQCVLDRVVDGKELHDSPPLPSLTINGGLESSGEYDLEPQQYFPEAVLTNRHAVLIDASPASGDVYGRYMTRQGATVTRIERSCLATIGLLSNKDTLVINVHDGRTAGMEMKTFVQQIIDQKQYPNMRLLLLRSAFLHGFAAEDTSNETLDSIAASDPLRRTLVLPKPVSEAAMTAALTKPVGVASPRPSPTVAAHVPAMIEHIAVEARGNITLPPPMAEVKPAAAPAPIAAAPSTGSLAVAGASVSASVTPVVGRAMEMTATGPALRVLLAEDNRINQQVAVKLLSMIHVVPDVVSDGQQAAEWYERSVAEGRPYACILMDLHMPILSGYESAALIRKHAAQQFASSRTRPYIVAVTADALVSTRESCLAGDFNAVITKPFVMRKLAELLLSIERDPA